MNMEVFWISGSAPAWRVLLALEVKKLEYSSRILQTDKKEQKQDWFLALNPRGQIPLLIDGDIVITESLAILHYLERKYPATPLFGSDAAETAVVEQYLHEIISYVDKPVADFVQPVFRNKIEHYRSTLDATAASILSELAKLESRLPSEGTWLTGHNISAADIVLVPTIQRLRRAIKKESQLSAELGLGNLAETFPRLNSWNDHIEVLPAFENTFPPHWRE